MTFRQAQWAITRKMTGATGKPPRSHFDECAHHAACGGAEPHPTAMIGKGLEPGHLHPKGQAKEGMKRHMRTGHTILERIRRRFTQGPMSGLGRCGGTIPVKPNCRLGTSEALRLRLPPKQIPTKLAIGRLGAVRYTQTCASLPKSVSGKSVQGPLG